MRASFMCAKKSPACAGLVALSFGALLLGFVALRLALALGFFLALGFGLLLALGGLGVGFRRRGGVFLGFGSSRRLGRGVRLRCLCERGSGERGGNQRHEQLFGHWFSPVSKRRSMWICLQ